MVLQFPPSDDQPSPRTGASKLKYKVVVGVGGLAGLFGIGSTLAANISLNNGGAVEFGQGVAQTAACDDDGFTVTPITSYDNAHSMFRLDKVQVSGLNLTPVGTTTDGGGLYGTPEERAANAGKYWDDLLGRWRNTCDNVVLDFKAYTDNSDYANYTENNYSDKSGTSITSPVMWSQLNGQAANSQETANSGFAVVFDSTNNESNYASGTAQTGVRGKRSHESSYLSFLDLSASDSYTNFAHTFHLSGGNTDHASFSFGSSRYTAYWTLTVDRFYGDFRPNAATISKITVQSMKYFPANYLDYRYEYDGQDLPLPGLPPVLN